MSQIDPTDPRYSKLIEAFNRAQAQKAQAFHILHQQTPKGPHHGKYRRPNPTAYRDPTQGAGGSAGGASAYSWDTDPFLPISTYRRSPAFPAGSFAPTPAGVSSITQAQIQKDIADITNSLMRQMVYGFSIREAPKPRHVPYAGVCVGEIIGHRAWLIREGGLLGSLAHDFVWKPGEIVRGDIDECVSLDYVYGIDHIFGGTYAFRDHTLDEITMRDFETMRMKVLPEVRRFGGPDSKSSSAYVFGLAVGTISMWGEVVEHERGYRSQFARLRSIDAAVGIVPVEHLKEKYGV